MITWSYMTKKTMKNKNKNTLKKLQVENKQTVIAPKVPSFRPHFLVSKNTPNVVPVT